MRFDFWQSMHGDDERDPHRYGDLHIFAANADCESDRDGYGNGNQLAWRY